MHFRPAPGVSHDGALLGYTLVPAAQTGHGRAIRVNRKDVNEIQLAKAAIRTGVEILLTEAGATHDDIDAFIVAGAFGSYLDLESSIRVGMFRPCQYTNSSRWEMLPAPARANYSSLVPVGLMQPGLPPGSPT